MRRDKATRIRCAEHAKAQLREAQRTRQSRHDLLTAAIEMFGDIPNGRTPVSGIYNPLFPDRIKDELRTLAENIGNQVEYAYRLWCDAGRRAHTLRPLAEEARKLRDGKVSYY